MCKTLCTKVKTRLYELEVDNKSMSLIIRFKGVWSPSTGDEFMGALQKFIKVTAGGAYSLTLDCVEFKATPSELRAMVGPFLQAYREAGFKYVRLISENPQKVFRSIIKEVGAKVGFSTEFCDSHFAIQTVI